jgi:hypothetical protein
VSAAEEAEIVFVVDVSSFTKEGFLGTTTYEGAKVDLKFDDEGKGVFLNQEMAGRLKVRKGSPITIIVEGDKVLAAQTTVASVGKELKISDAKVYYGVGSEGGAIIRVRKS